MLAACGSSDPSGSGASGAGAGAGAGVGGGTPGQGGGGGGGGSSSSPDRSDEFIGPLEGWSDLQADFGAVGDGVADDTGAIQSALDALMLDENPHVLWLPAGTYRITQTLEMHHHRYVSVLGEDPTRVTILWDGAEGGVMLHANGVGYSRFGRITWDGNQGKAETAIENRWDATGTYPGFNEHMDEVFKDVGYGVRAGLDNHADAETSIIRCQFIRCDAGVSIESFNALDWFVRDSWFEDCTRGVTNHLGAGNFHVYDSVFLRSKEADVHIKNTQYFSLRRNVSIESKSFFLASPIGANSAETTLQENVIIDPTGVAVKIDNVGPVLMLDNTIRSPGGAAGPVVQGGDIHLTSLGNTFTVADPVDVQGTPLRIDEKIVEAATISTPAVDAPAPAPNRARPVYELPEDADGAAIQAAIDQATAEHKGERPVVHFGGGSHGVAQTITIPAGSDVQLVGDGAFTRLAWTGGPMAAPVLRVVGPSHATLRDFRVTGNQEKTTTALEIVGVDQEGAAVRMYESSFSVNEEHGLFVNGLDHARVDLREFYHQGAGGVSVHVVGGPASAAGTGESRTTIFGGASSGNAVSYEIRSGASLVVQDIWYESGSPAVLARMNDTGALTLNGLRFAAPMNAEPAFDIGNGSRGALSILTSNIDTRLRVAGDAQDTRVLALGNQWHLAQFLEDTSTGATVVSAASVYYDNGAKPAPDHGTATPDFVKEMLAQTRATRPAPLDAYKEGVSDVRVYRVYTELNAIGAEIRPNP